MKKENILKQIVLQEYGEKKHPKLTKNQFSLSSELYFEVERMYKELGGTQEEPPLKFGAWDISTPKFNVSSTNSEQCKLCVHSPLYIINTRLLWKQTIGGNGS